jgi:hypothetical protein
MPPSRSESAYSARLRGSFNEADDTKLFDRVGRRIELTEAGRVFLAEARAVLARGISWSWSSDRGTLGSDLMEGEWVLVPRFKLPNSLSAKSAASARATGMLPLSTAAATWAVLPMARRMMANLLGLTGRTFGCPEP